LCVDLFLFSPSCSSALQSYHFGSPSNLFSRFSAVRCFRTILVPVPCFLYFPMNLHPSASASFTLELG
jgi:hypothetical protein